MTDKNGNTLHLLKVCWPLFDAFDRTAKFLWMANIQLLYLIVVHDQSAAKLKTKKNHKHKNTQINLKS